MTDPVGGASRRALSRPSTRGALVLVVAVAAATYANALGNGWAFDDPLVVTGNPVVTEGRWGEALTAPYRVQPDEPPALYRPTTSLALALEWRLFGDRPLAFHAVSVALHALVSVLVGLLLLRVVAPAAAGAGAALFAVHPVHVEAVANVVGQAELLAAAAYLGAVLLYLSARDAGAAPRALRLIGIASLYALALGAKEIAVTLPAALLLVELAVPRAAGGRPVRALAAEAPLFLALAALLAFYLAARWWIVGSVRGDEIAPELLGLGAGGRVLTALAAWPTIVRLLIFPLDLAADYGPGILTPATGLRADVLGGALILAGLIGVATAGWRRAPVGALAAGWLLITLLPVSNLIVPAGVVLAERTLYLPSVALAIAVGGALAALDARPALRRRAWAVAAAVGILLMARSALRNPTWLNSFTVMDTLAREHPESWRGHRSRAQGLLRVNELEQARRELEAAVALLPNHYGLLCEAGVVSARLGLYPRAQELLGRAVALGPDRPVAYRLLAETQLLAGDGRAAHGTALAGLARWGSDRALWALVSESYVVKGDLAAAIRAREAALAADPGSTRDRERLVELLHASHVAPPVGAIP